MRLMWLADVARLARLTVHELTDWKYQGRDLDRVDAIVVHTTVTPDGMDDRALASFLRRGRVDLAGPLYQYGIARNADVWVIASGKCNHNGSGMHGNQSVAVALFNDGDADPHPEVQYQALVVLCTALVTKLGISVARVRGHGETDPRRKTDPKAIDMNRLRRDIAHFLALPEQDDDMDKATLDQLGRIEMRVTATHQLTLGIAETIADDAAVAEHYRNSLAALIHRTHEDMKAIEA